MKPTNYDARLQEIDFFQIHPHLIPYIGDRYEKYKINSDVLDLIQEHKPAEFKQLFNAAIAAADAEYSQKQQNNNYIPQNKPKALKL